MTVKQKFFGVLIGIVLIAGLSTGLAVKRIAEIAPELDKEAQDVSNLKQHAIPLMLRAKDIKADVIQIQQWLTDISATRGQDGLNDGFDMAAKYAAKFQENAKAAKHHADALGMTDISEALMKMVDAFPPYYATGREMAQAYIDQGPAGGNKKMAEFDAVAESIGSATDVAVALVMKRVAVELKTLESRADTTKAEGHDLVTMLLVIDGVALLFALGGGVGLYRVLKRDFGALEQDVSLLIRKAFDRPFILKGDRKDEFGPVAKAFEAFRNNEEEVKTAVMQHQAERDKQIARAEKVDSLCKAFEGLSSELVRALRDASHQLMGSSQMMSSVVGQAAEKATVVASASGRASSNVQTVATAAEELSSSIGEISRQVSQASDVISAAVNEAMETNTKIQGLAESADKIGDVVKLITDIAEQTNLLALNATIEAARAGDAGKGFAVVASEVKNLANQTARATEDISQQVLSVQDRTKEAVMAIETIASTISQVDTIASSIAAAVEEQGAATQEIAHNIEQAAQGTHNVSENIGGVSQAVDETNIAAEQIQAASNGLTAQSKNFEDAVETFLSSVRAA